MTRRVSFCSSPVSPSSPASPNNSHCSQEEREEASRSTPSHEPSRPAREKRKQQGKAPAGRSAKGGEEEPGTLGEYARTAPRVSRVHKPTTRHGHPSYRRAPKFICVCVSELVQALLVPARTLSPLPPASRMLTPRIEPLCGFSLACSAPLVLFFFGEQPTGRTSSRPRGTR